MNKKGFTLVELLAVIVILALLALVANSSVTNVVRNSKSDLYSAQIELIESAAKSWGVENIDKIPVEGTCSYIKLKDLKGYGLLEEDVVNPKTNEKFSDDTYIKITSKVNSEGVLKTSYEVDANNIDSCLEVYPTICDLIQGDENVVGSKYICEVKQDTKYNFFVLSHNEDGTVNLIMDQNINSDGTLAGMTGVAQSANANQYNLVSWNSSGSNTGGPVTAMDFLYNATKDWTNIDPVNYTYNDKIIQKTTAEDTNYTSFVSVNGVATITALDGITTTTIGTEIEPLRARMPIYSSDTTITEVTNASYLYENLDVDGNNTPLGYWTLSSCANDSFFAWIVNYSGSVVLNNGDVGINNSYGVRPVITLEL